VRETQLEFANLLGVSIRTLGRWEHGELPVNPIRLRNLDQYQKIGITQEIDKESIENEKLINTLASLIMKYGIKEVDRHLRLLKEKYKLLR
jgi:transcriptional regulator with XRE-family HTH domain